MSRVDLSTVDLETCPRGTWPLVGIGPRKSLKPVDIHKLRFMVHYDVFTIDAYYLIPCCLHMAAVIRYAVMM